MKKIIITNAGRKYTYIALMKGNGVYPAIYFRKSKWISQKEFESLINYIKETLLNS
jgi:hypothetical protein